MNHLDTLFLILTAYLVYQGYRKGFIHTLKIFLLVLGSTVFAYLLSESGYQFLYPSFFSKPYLAQFLVFAFFVVAFFFLAHAAEKLLTRLLRKISLKWLDQVLGTLFGMIKASFLIFLFVSVIGGLNIQSLKEQILSGFFVKKVYLVVRQTTNWNLIQNIRRTQLWRNP